VKTILTLLIAVGLSAATQAEESWRKVAFIGDANVKKISGLAEVMAPTERILHPGEGVKAGETVRVWRGAELILQMKGSKSLVRAAGPVLLRLAPEKEGFNRASITGEEVQRGFIVRAVHGAGRYCEGDHWLPIKTGMTLPEGSKVRAFHDTILDFYNPTTHQVIRVTDHKRQTVLDGSSNATGGAMLFAAKSP